MNLHELYTLITMHKVIERNGDLLIYPLISIRYTQLKRWMNECLSLAGETLIRNIWSATVSTKHSAVRHSVNSLQLPYLIYFHFFHFSWQRRPVWKRRLLIIWTSCPCFYSWRILRMEFGQSLRWLSLGLLCQPRRRYIELSLGRTGWVTINDQVLWIKILTWAILKGVED